MKLVIAGGIGGTLWKSALHKGHAEEFLNLPFTEYPGGRLDLMRLQSDDVDVS